MLSVPMGARFVAGRRGPGASVLVGPGLTSNGFDAGGLVEAPFGGGRFVAILRTMAERKLSADSAPLPPGSVVPEMLAPPFVLAGLVASGSGRRSFSTVMPPSNST